MDVPPVLIVVRHGQSEHHVCGLTGGWTDTPLTAQGHDQARRLAARLAQELGDTPVTLYTSDLRRCQQTAAPIAEQLGVTPLVDARLREHNNGAAANLTVAEATARYPDTFNQLWTLDLRPFPEAETWREFATRAGEFLAALPPETPLPILVTHGGTLMNLVRWWLRLDLDTLSTSWFGAHPSSITELRADEWGQRGLARLNDIAHLALTDRPPLGGG